MPKNDAIMPPFRLNSIGDIEAYTAHAGARYWDAKLIRIAERIQIKRPGILNRLSSQSDFLIRLPDTVVYEEMSTTAKDHDEESLPFTIDAEFLQAIRRQRQRFCDATPGEPRTYEELIRRLATEDAPDPRRTAGTDPTDGGFTPSLLLQNAVTVDSVVLSAIRRYIDHGDTEARDRIESITRRLCFYSPTTHNLDTPLIDVTTTRRVDLTHSDCIVLFQAVFHRTRTIVQRWYHLGVGEQIDRLTRRLTRLGAHPNLIRGVGDALRSISSTDWFDNRDRVQEVHDRIMMITSAFAQVASQQTLTKVRSLAEDILKKHERFRSLFAHIFDYDVMLTHLKKTKNEAFSGGAFLRSLPLRRRIVPGWQRYTAYPTKDLHDLAKGIISQDCTKPSGLHGLADNHLETPEFFNIRLFDESRWIGNMYCLALSETTIVVDHIQFGFPKKIAAIDFVSDLRRLFNDLIGETQPKPEVWLLYSDISNRAWLRKTVFETTFAEYKSDLVPRENRFRSFSSYTRRRERSTFARLL